jgi:hypothetical protein
MSVAYTFSCRGENYHVANNLVEQARKIDGKPQDLSVKEKEFLEKAVVDTNGNISMLKEALENRRYVESQEYAIRLDGYTIRIDFGRKTFSPAERIQIEKILTDKKLLRRSIGLIEKYSKDILARYKIHDISITGLEPDPKKAYAGYVQSADVLELTYGALEFEQLIAHELAHVKFYADQEIKDREDLAGFGKDPVWQALYIFGLGNKRYDLFLDTTYTGGEQGHPYDNESELFASSAMAYQLYADRLASRINQADANTKKFGILVWNYLRDKIFHGKVFTSSGNDPFKSQEPLTISNLELESSVGSVMKDTMKDKTETSRVEGLVRLAAARVVSCVAQDRFSKRSIELARKIMAERPH